MRIFFPTAYSVLDRKAIRAVVRQNQLAAGFPDECTFWLHISLHFDYDHGLQLAQQNAFDSFVWQPCVMHVPERQQSRKQF
jgi:hypothetical protein